MSEIKKNILIVGASSGIGSRVAQSLSAESNLVLTARNIEKIKAFSDKSFSVFSLDVCSESEISDFAKNCPAIDGMVYCPGVADVFPAKHIVAKNTQKVMSVNFEGAALLTSALLRAKKINTSASLVYISSQASRYPFFGSAIYSASKAALESFSAAMAKELQPKNIRSNCVAPAYVESPMLDSAKDSLSSSFVDEMKKMHPNAFANAEEIAEIIVFLLSNSSVCINGQVVEAGSFNINIPKI